jgi:hypothetical protein
MATGSWEINKFWWLYMSPEIQGEVEDAKIK